MKPKRFESDDEARSVLSSCLGELSNLEGVAQEVASQLSKSLATPNLYGSRWTEAERKRFDYISSDLGRTGSYFAVHGDDLLILKEVALLVSGAIAASTLEGWGSAAVASLLVLLWKFRKKRVKLEPEQAAILMELRKDHHGLTADQLYARCRWPFSDPSAVSHCLDGLEDVRKEDGTVALLVQRGSKGRWYAVDV